jgi:hypothetical protein
MLCAGETLIPMMVAPQFTWASPPLTVEVTPEATSVTETVAIPRAAQVTLPCVSTVAMDGLLDDHWTVRDTLKVPVNPVKVAEAFNVVLPASATMTLAGEILSVRGAPTTAITPPLVEAMPVAGSTARTVAEPSASPLAFPLASIETTAGFEVLQVTLEVMSCVVPELKWPVA